jgi:hypothetical protein
MAEGYNSGYSWNPLESLGQFGKDAGFQLGQYGKGIGDTLGGDGAFSMDSMFGGGENSGSGWLGGAGKIGMGVWQGLQAKKQLGLQEDMFDFQKEAFNKNYAGQARNWNMNVGSAFRANQNASAPGNSYYAGRTEADELKQYGVANPNNDRYSPEQQVG